MRRLWLVPPALLLLGSNPSVETVPPLCTVAQLAAGTCAPAKLGTRVRISNGNVSLGDTDCTVGTGAFLVLCEFDGANWIGTTAGGNANTRQAATDCTIEVGGATGEVCQELDANQLYVCEVAPCNAAGWVLYTPSSGADIESVGNCAAGACTGPIVFSGAGDETLKADGFIGPGADPADAGALRLSNAESILWESSPASANEIGFTTTAVEEIVATVSSLGFIVTGGDIHILDIFPGIFFEDTSFGSDGSVWAGSCSTDNDCGWQMTNNSGADGVRVAMLTVRTTDAGASTLFLGGAGLESETASPADAVTVDETGNASFITTGGDVADGGKIRLNNADSICAEASAAGTDVCLVTDTSEVWNVTGGLFDVNDIGDPTFAKFSEDNVKLWWDLDRDGAYDTGEPILSMNQPTNLAGDETVTGSLTVTGGLDVAGIPDALEEPLYRFRLAAGSIPGPDDCWAMIGPSESVIPAAGADPTNRCRQFLPYDIHLTHACATFVDGTLPTAGNCILDFYEGGERGTVHFTVNVSTGAAGDLDTVGDSKCTALDIDVDDAPELFYFQADTDAADCDASGNWPEIEVEVRGFRASIP